MQKPPKWTDVYPQGTKEGDEEQKFFKALARHPEYKWRSVAAIMKTSGLTRKRVEEILKKYHKLGMVFNSPTNEENWGYWERVPEMLNSDPRSISTKDQDKRIKDASSITYRNDGIIADRSESCLTARHHIVMADGISKEMQAVCVTEYVTEYVSGLPWDFEAGIAIWDFQTVIGDSIKAKYAHLYENATIVETTTPRQ